jgi:hypothetical protein
VTFEVAGEPSERPMRLEVAELNQPPMPISIIDKKWTKAEPRGLPDNLAPNNLELRFNEVVARRLRFVVTDFANQPLRLNNVKVTRWARKVIFEKPDEKKYTLPLRLFAGNASATPPGYEDLRKRVPENLKLAPALATIEKSVQNPAYIEPPKPLHEQMPWLVYVVLGAASLVLLIILALLVKQAITRHDAAEVAAKT